MKTSRRNMMKSALGLHLSMAVNKAWATAVTPQFPDRQNFQFEGTFLDAAYTHPMCLAAYRAEEAFLSSRVHQPSIAWPRTNPRNAAVQAFAELINAAPAEVAVVPSTMGGENMLCAALGLGPDAGVVTDAYHYDASLAMYGEMQRKGIPVTVVEAKDNRISLDDLDRAITKSTRLVAISQIASLTGFQHDLKAVCGLAHSKGAMVYADIVQAVGAVPVNIKESGVDFACAGTYKWLMGDFGIAFLYVRPDRLDRLQHVQWGWRSFTNEAHHILPFDDPGPAIGTWTQMQTTAAHFEVGSPAWAPLAAAAASIPFVRSVGIENIQRHRQPMIDRLQAELPKLGFLPLTPAPTTGPTVAFAYKGAQAKFAAVLDAQKVRITLRENHIRVSVSIYNDMEDIERLLRVLKA